MHVSDALRTRISTRAFLATPVAVEVVHEILDTARWSPSGGNLQPWRVIAVSGEARQAAIDAVAAALARKPRGEQGDYPMYPADLWEPYRSRRYQVGEDMYARLGIPRADKPARLRWFARNYQFFGAPMALFCSVDRRMGPPQWSDLGMFLQSVMLLLREAGYDSCAQECWAVYPKTIGEFIHIPAERMLFTGMAIGQRNPGHAINGLQSQRAAVDTFTHFHGL